MLKLSSFEALIYTMYMFRSAILSGLGHLMPLSNDRYFILAGLAMLGSLMPELWLLSDFCWFSQNWSWQPPFFMCFQYFTVTQRQIIIGFARCMAPPVTYFQKSENWHFWSIYTKVIIYQKNWNTIIFHFIRSCITHTIKYMILHTTVSHQGTGLQNKIHEFCIFC